MTKSPNKEEYDGIRNNTIIKDETSNKSINNNTDNYVRKESVQTNNSLFYKKSILGKLLIKYIINYNL